MDVGPGDVTVGGARIDRLRRQLVTRGRAPDDWFEERVERLLSYIAQRPVRLALILLILNRAIGGLLYSLFEADSDWFDGAWWVLVTQTTVGYGDFAPETFLGRATVELVMWTGILSLERARQADPLATVSLDDDFDHLIARLESDADYLARHLRRLKDVTNDPDVVEALRAAHQRREEGS
ncbi:MAG: potassium channel family protein [Solirubrobacteraceae bacterium]